MRQYCLARQFGLTIDSLLEASVVLADGRSVTANGQAHEDLFWAIRGGGGNYGIVTSFLFKAHPVNTVVAGPMLWPLEEAAEVVIKGVHQESPSRSIFWRRSSRATKGARLSTYENGIGC